ncbi:DUF2142 domain-containing protein [Pedococcus sp. NPDC057267]|uniref:DUF2142 domain-containing protein n=1 Tax=Pedococcus sp. NPDC057267 TaxID=3346077 RepID=UPI0036403257
MVTVAALSLLFGTFFAIAVPVGWGPDEAAQFDRAYQVASGHFAPVRLPDVDGSRVYGGAVPSSAVALNSFAGPPGRAPAGGRPLFVSSAARDAALARPVNAEPVVTWFPNTAAYSPVPYVPAAVGVRLARLLDLDIGTAWRVMRLAQVLAYTLVVSLGMLALRAFRLRWPAMALALLPTALYQTGVVSADALTNAVAFTFVALVTKAAVLLPRDEGRTLSRWEAAAMYGAAVALPLMKPTYVILSLLLLVVPRPAGPSPARSRGARLLRAWPAAGALLLAVGGLLWWSSLSAGTADAMGWLRGPAQRHLVQPAEQLSYVLGHPLALPGIAVRTLAINDWIYLTSFLGQMGYGLSTNVVTSVAGATCTVVALGVGLAHAGVGRAGRVRLTAMALVWLASVLAIFGTLYLAFTPLRASFVTGVQGRYFVPLGLLGVSVAAQLVRRRSPVAPTTARRLQRTIPLLCLAALVLAALKYVAVMYLPWFHA